MLKSAISNPTSAAVGFKIEDRGLFGRRWPPRGTSFSGSFQSGRRARRCENVAITRQEWAPSIVHFLFDIFNWMAIYGMASYLRNDIHFLRAVSNLLSSSHSAWVIVQALFIIGGYILERRRGDSPIRPSIFWPCSLRWGSAPS